MTDSTDGVYRVDLEKQQFTFSAAHFITFAGDICERLHGHNYGVRASVRGRLDENRYVIDFIALRDAILRVTERMDHRMLLPESHPEITVTRDEEETTARFRDRRWVFPNEDCLILPVTNTTAEEIARVIADEVWKDLGSKTSHLVHFEIGVDENQGQWGTYVRPMG